MTRRLADRLAGDCPVRWLVHRPAWWARLGAIAAVGNAMLQAARFADRDAAKEWIIRNQLGRRNLTDAQRVQLALRLKPVAQAKAKERQGSRTDIRETFPGCSSRATDEIAEAAGVSRKTVERVEKVNAKATPELRAAMNSNAVTINTAAGGSSDF